MVRLLYVLSLILLAAAAAVLALCVQQWSQSDDLASQFLRLMGAVQTYAQNADKATDDQQEATSPLVSAAQAFGLYLNPPPAPVKEKVVVQEAPKPAAPAVQPVAASPRFKVRGTSYCVDEPQRSMVLIWEPGATDSGRWIREGTQVGHCTIHEIRPGSVVYRGGDQLREMAVELETVDTTAVADSALPVRSDPRTAVSNTRVTRPIESPKQRAGNRGPTVGSARTAALD